MSTALRPGRLGPGPIQPALVDALDLALVRRVSGLMPGERPAALPGAGSELEQLRAYAYGDDVRHLDPAATARTGEPHVRVHVAERELETWIVLDATPSMEFGTADRSKADVAEGVALVVGRLGGRRGNRLGLVVAGERVRLLPPHQGRTGQTQLLLALRGERCPDRSATAELSDALMTCDRVANRRGLVVVVSDFLGDTAWAAPLGRLAARHAVLAVEVRDPREDELPAVGHVSLRDPETGAERLVNTSDARVRAAFAGAAADQRERLVRTLRHAGAHHVALSTGGPWLRVLAAALRGPVTRAAGGTP
ncbi:DUF58 domain-containing protein [Solirubrobacter ginsenosidimutans]|uniref:DUF58 domain-containing protein n=1 Tax=Solirubrobacter ginsenosidimutans TaxID=490573 RepID=A0A9X3MU19_9ACTN|nr:DUF58 domain-containing protein [Solirubrobacter ginsenosidimutans]MDA0162594.1 DUF58 domain-containing protein [Solirubrobacter ginsenosidimutans]